VAGDVWLAVPLLWYFSFLFLPNFQLISNLYSGGETDETERREAATSPKN
jgi:hypothetical protein